MIKSSIDNQKNFVSLYPYDLKKNTFNKNFKIVFIGRLSLSNLAEVKSIWNKYNKEIMNNFLIIENKKFFHTVGIEFHQQLKLCPFPIQKEARIGHTG